MDFFKLETNTNVVKEIKYRPKCSSIPTGLNRASLEGFKHKAYNFIIMTEPDLAGPIKTLSLKKNNRQDKQNGPALF